jgi:uncharacterized protein (TIGR04255 family)
MACNWSCRTLSCYATNMQSGNLATPPEFQIPADEPFPHLPKAPIAEAIIEFITSAQVEWNEQSVTVPLTERLPGFSAEAEHQSAFLVELSPGSAQSSFNAPQWNGIRYLSADGKRTARFLRDRLNFSQAAPYSDWSDFCQAALHLWKIYQEVANPEDIQRLGVRFINGFSIPHEGVDLDEYFREGPHPPVGLDELSIAGFQHHEHLALPGLIYELNIMKSIQSVSDGSEVRPSILLDVDVYTNQPIASSIDVVTTHLNAMRWLKNRAFFGSLQASLIEKLQGAE